MSAVKSVLTKYNTPVETRELIYKWANDYVKEEGMTFRQAARQAVLDLQEDNEQQKRDFANQINGRKNG